MDVYFQAFADDIVTIAVAQSKYIAQLIGAGLVRHQKTGRAFTIHLFRLDPLMVFHARRNGADVIGASAWSHPVNRSDFADLGSLQRGSAAGCDFLREVKNLCGLHVCGIFKLCDLRDRDFRNSVNLAPH